MWRGGRRPKQPATSRQTNGYASGQEVIELGDDDEDELEEPQISPNDLEDDEDDQDPDCPFQSIIEVLDIPLGTAVLQLAVPHIPSGARMLRNKAIIAVACAHGAGEVFVVPLTTPSASAKAKIQKAILRTGVTFNTDGFNPNALTTKLVWDVETKECTLLLAAAFAKLDVYRLFVSDDRSFPIGILNQQSWHLPHPASQVAFHPTSNSTQLLISDVSGAVRLFDPAASSTPASRPTSSTSELANEDSAEDGPLGRWLMTYFAPFTSSNPALPRRSRLLDAKWVLNGRAVLVLLQDGEWGVWDVSGPFQAGKLPQDFILRGHLGASVSAEPTKPTKASSKLAPMTPNTRKAKSENFFAAPAKEFVAAVKGGIRVTPSGARAGQVPDESIMLWHGDQIYIIPSMQAFQQRSTTGNSANLGSLYSPGITHVTDIDLQNESITSISHFGIKATSSGLGQLNQRDLLVSTEYRLIISQSARSTTATTILFEPASAIRPNDIDQRMLDAGDLELDGMDRMLDNMANGNARPRRVGFAD